MKRVFLIGHPVLHSISPAIHNAAFRALNLDYTYELLDTARNMLAQTVARLRADDCAGANVTIPHKETIVSCLDEISDTARAIGAVNTIYKRDNLLIGDNTDAIGFCRALEHAHVSTRGARVAILGAGGAARAVAFALRDAARIAIMNRTRERAEKLVDDFRALKLPLVVGAWNEIENSNLIVNATSVGMFPLVEDSPLPREIAIPRDAVVFDLVYRPARTRLIAQSERAGARTIGGLEMLVYQGARAFELWTNKNAPLDVMMRAAIV